MGNVRILQDWANSQKTGSLGQVSMKAWEHYTDIKERTSSGGNESLTMLLLSDQLP